MNITSKGRVRVNWHETVDNFSVESKNKIQRYFIDKYGVERSKIQVIFRPIKTDERYITLGGDTSVSDIMNKQYQRELFKKWLEKEEIDNIDNKRLYDIDDLVNINLNVDLDTNRNQTYRLIKLELDNFLSFGENNILNISDKKGIVGVNSNPKNQGGKTTLILEALRFAIYGKTNKTTKNEDIFNLYSETNKVKVSITFELNDNTYQIDRILLRKPKRAGGYTVNNVVEFYQIMPDNSVISLNDEDAKQTTAEIINSFGLESDFDLTVIADNKTLTDLIETKPTERAELLNRYIGLEILEKKHEIAKKIYSDFSKKLLSNQYTIEQLTDTNNGLIEEIKSFNDLVISYDKDIEKFDLEIKNLELQKDNLLSQLKEIDSSLVNINEDGLKLKLETIKNNGDKLKKDIKEYTEVFKKLANIEYDELKYDTLVKQSYTLKSELTILDSKILVNESRLKEINDSKVCKICNEPVNDIIFKDEKTQKTIDLESFKNEKTLKIAELNKLEIEIKSYSVLKEQNDKKNKTELHLVKLNLDLANLRNDYKINNDKLKDYLSNKDNIQNNQKISIEVEKLKSDLFTKNNEKNRVVDTKQRVLLNVKTNENKVISNNDIIEKIKIEKVEDLHYSTYVKMMGLKGISKMIFKTTIPLINAELSNLLNDVCDFDVELQINDKNNVDFVIIKDGVANDIKGGSGLEKTISSLALRNVLSVVSTLSKPSFIIFDETWGAIAEDNLDNVKLLLDKIKKNYDNIFIITHNNIINDWADYMVTIEKNKNVSKITSK